MVCGCAWGAAWVPLLCKFYAACPIVTIPVVFAMALMLQLEGMGMAI